MPGKIALFSAEFLADPYPFYRELRATEPVYYDERMGWMLTCYSDLKALARDPRLGRAAYETARMAELPHDVRAAAMPITDGLKKELARTDPPDHTRLRALVTKAFTPRMIETLRPRIQEIAEDLLRQAHGTRRMDVIRDFAYPLPASVIAELLGIPGKDRDRLKAWTVDRIAFMGSVRTASDPVDLARRAGQSAQALAAYFRDLMAERRRQPRDDLISALVRVEAEQGDRLSDAEVIANCVNLLSAGHETTTNLIGNGLLALLRHPEQLQLLRETPELIPSAVEEFLRYDSPVQMTPRAAVDDIEIRGKTIRRGDRVMLVLGAANRDPDRFSDPDRLDITRRGNDHFSFGFDRHFCLGAHLARAEAQIAFFTLLRRSPVLALESDLVEWHPNPVFRGLKVLPVLYAD